MIRTLKTNVTYFYIAVVKMFEFGLHPHMYAKDSWYPLRILVWCGITANYALGLYFYDAMQRATFRCFVPDLSLSWSVGILDTVVHLFQHYILGTQTSNVVLKHLQARFAW